MAPFIAAEIIVHRPVHEISRTPSANIQERHVNQDVEGLVINVTIDKNTFTIGETCVLQFVSLRSSNYKENDWLGMLEHRQQIDA